MRHPGGAECPIRTLVVDDHPVVRDGLVAILAGDPAIEIVGQASSGEEAMQLLAGGLAPDVVVLDVRLPDSSGLALCAGFRRQFPKARVVLFTSFPSDATMIEAFTSGARGFLAKESQSNNLREAVHAVVAGGMFIDPRLAPRLVAMATRGHRATGPFGLTRQQMRVLELLPRGFSNTQIGEQLGVNEETVKTHLRAILRKLGVSNRTEAATIARREGLA